MSTVVKPGKNVPKKLIIAAVIVLAAAVIAALTVCGIRHQKAQRYFETLAPGITFYRDANGLYYSSQILPDNGILSSLARPDGTFRQYVENKKRVNTQKGFTVELSETVVTEGTASIRYEITCEDPKAIWAVYPTLEKKIGGSWYQVDAFHWHSGWSGMPSGGIVNGRYELNWAEMQSFNTYPNPSVTCYPGGYTPEPGEYRLAFSGKTYEKKDSEASVLPECTGTFCLAAEFTVVPAE